MLLQKRLGLLHVFCIASGAMISSGLFILPGLAHASAGPSVVLSYFLAGLVAATSMLSVSELTTAMPKAGGDYFFVTRAMGSGVGTAAGLLTWFSLTLKSAFALVGMAAFAKIVLPVNPLLIGLLLCAGFVVLNLLGVKKAAGFQVVLVVGLLLLMVFYLARGFPHVKPEKFVPFAPNGLRGTFATVGLVFISYGGLLQIASVSEEVREPGRVIPLGMILSLIIVTIFYTLMVSVTSGVLEASALHESQTPITDGARAFMGAPGAIVISVAAMLAFVSTANAGIMAASRYLLALSRDRLMPEPFARVSSRFGSPYVAVLITGAFAAVALFLPLETLVKAASTVLILSCILANVSVLVLRESGVQNYRPIFKAPLYPWNQILGTVALAFIIFEMGEQAYVIALALIVCAFAVYWFYGRKRSAQESGLLHLMGRITDRKLATGSLEAELKQIIRERDEIVIDRFDRMVEACPVLDLHKPMEADEFFELAGQKMAERLNLDAKNLKELLMKRERESGTVLRPGLAVPHVVIEGEGKFDLLLARCKEGIRFPSDPNPVYAAFVLMGTRDERNFHLRTLAAIAQVVQDRSFDKRWKRARGEQALQDVVLLGERHRAEE